MKCALEVVAEISKLIKSPQSKTPCFSSSNLSLLLIDLVTVYCAITSSLQSVTVLDKYEVLLGVWNEALSLQLDFEMRARITGVNTRMHTFDFLFGVSLGNHLRCHTNNLSKTLQHKSLSSAESQTVAKITLDVLQSLRNEDHFKNFYARVLLDQVHSQVDAPALPKKKKKRKPPSDFRLAQQMAVFTLFLKIRYIMKHWIL